MSGRWSSVLSLPVVAVLLAALTLGLVLVGLHYGLGPATFTLLVIPIALAVAYLAYYRTLPYEGARPVDEEPFEDPVEEADRIDSGLEEGGEPEPSRAPAAPDGTVPRSPSPPR